MKYISPSGNDSTGDGSAGNPWATLQHAWNTLKNAPDTVQLADGTYTAGLNATGGSHGMIFQGNMTTPQNVIVHAASGNPFAAAFGAHYQVQGMELRATNGAGADLIVAGQGGSIRVGDKMRFGGCGGQGHLVACFGGHITVLNGYTILTGGQYHMSAGDGGTIYFNTDGQPGLIACQNPNNPNFSAGFACAQNCGVINCQAVTWGGGATGKIFLVTNNGVITTMNGNANYFPGNVGGNTPTFGAGVSSTGGQYN